MDKQYLIHYKFQTRAGDGWQGSGRFITNLKHGVRHIVDLEELEKNVLKKLKESDPELQGDIDVAVVNIIPLPIK